MTEGSDVELVCAADGRPRPVVTWTKTGEHSSVVYPGGQKLIITNANRTEAGTYKCTATNGIGKVAAATIDVIMFCKFFLFALLDMLAIDIKFIQRAQSL